ncbi:DNA cytosine methyltransferase [Enterobacter huaxiensis]|uniref:DNA cytosine methyltransferase n=1 Tax=Enterobacter huaxiensis TaxID=2494702 RepID=UPI002175BCD6|nr:DNA cytosine methyltransferase [Enterobacter huaxiensis]MCS5452537.1 DNA cytosine methyltransferase [Enterobacter huaxiensis]
MTAFYNEIDPFAAQWLRNLIKAGLIAPGVVDERSIEDITPDELREFKQVHLFAGIGVWSYALRRAGWPDDRPVWSGSCPCQPFSAAGKGKGLTDERHLWPSMHHLVSVCKPPIVFGEQVASADGLQWLGIVQTDLENAGYATAAADLCAAGIGAPHIRQRIYWMADANGKQYQNGHKRSGENHRPDGEGAATELTGFCSLSQLADPSNKGSQRRVQGRPHPEREAIDRYPGCSGAISPANALKGFWRDPDWLYCRDGKWRAVESGAFPLANGASGRMGKIRAYGNAIVAPLAETFIKAAMAANDEFYKEAV